ncbi:hypothetical protein BP5796_06943 [Coleophoma crateriformis]|uniref:BTB domain-containing protein n=1 Tax=Coleophoma crateriformis TaxID=565419 RepID=A0A3D8RPV8_9HELO|nr:hypothetical protein BP5796_06943 [Coleophoma crateriformis]
MASPGGNGSSQAVRIHKFEWPGLQPDLRLEVFDSDEFHVHSTIMKLHSAFFRRFLDSPDKTADPSMPVRRGAFKYNWITKVDEDGSWALVSDTSQLTVKDKGYKLMRDRSEEIAVFCKLLKAIYRRDYIVDSVADLERLTRMADYYLALPALSFSLYMTLPKSHKFIAELIKCAPTIIETARKLRNTVLFRECLVYVMNPWDCPRYLDKKRGGKPLKDWNPALQKAFGAATINFHQQIVRVHQQLLDLRVEGGFSEFETGVLAKLKEEHEYTGGDRFPLPVFLQKLSYLCSSECESIYTEKGYDVEGIYDLEETLEELLDNQLTLSPKVTAGCDSFEEYLLCIKIEDELLPWDREQVDW